MSRLLLVPAMATVRIIVLAVKRNPRRSIPAVTVIAMAHGSSILHRSTGVKIIAGIAVQRTMIMPATV